MKNGEPLDFKCEAEMLEDTVAQALQGKMAGVVVTMDSAAPGATPSIRVRGNKSITQSNDPLYIVNGFPVGDLSQVPAATAPIYLVPMQETVCVTTGLKNGYGFKSSAN